MRNISCYGRHALAGFTLLLSALPALATVGPPDGSSDLEKAAIADDPAFMARPLVLQHAKVDRGVARSLFNGKDLSAWNRWLGLADPASTYAGTKDRPIGLNKDPKGVFSVVRQDGAPAIRVSGEVWGGLVTKAEYADYHLHLEYKWGAKVWTAMPRNNGVLYHSHGRYGAFFNTWMSGVEFEMVPHSIGMLLCVGDSHGKATFQEVDWKVGARAEVGHDPGIVYPHRRYMPGGRAVDVLFPGYNVEAATDAEKPIGEWNTIDLYVYGDQAVHVVNGTPVMVVTHLTTTDRNHGRPKPLTKGRIQLQSEGAETYFRNLSIVPIKALPTVVAGEAR